VLTSCDVVSALRRRLRKSNAVRRSASTSVSRGGARRERLRSRISLSSRFIFAARVTVIDVEDTRYCVRHSGRLATRYAAAIRDHRS
jgi:hypothetical protein